MQKCDIKWLVFVLAVALLFSVFGLPYFSQLGHPLFAILVYAFLAILFLYGRENRRPKVRTRQRVRNSGESSKSAQQVR
jgi:hypothetical protein